jgi:RNA polymerase sigma-70 factor (ECF subfamily)
MVAELGSIVTVSGNDTMPEVAASASQLDAESARWLRALAEPGAAREVALARLHELLLSIARREVARRGPRLAITGPELDDLAYQAAADALLAITGKVGQFRGEGRFMTWAYKFVIFEVSAKIGRHFWRHPAVPLGARTVGAVGGRFGFDPAHQAEWRDLAAAVRRAVDTEPTRASARSLWRSWSTASPWIPWSCRWALAATPSTK